MTKESHYAVSDGVTGQNVLLGIFSSHMEAVRSFERAFGARFRDTAIVNTVGDDDVYAVRADGSIEPMGGIRE
jgi:hypothetical protein